MIENLVVSLETAKKLKSAGWNKPVEFAWDEFGLCRGGWPLRAPLNPGYIGYPAPTAEELLSELPEKIEIDGEEHYLSFFIEREDYSVQYVCEGACYNCEVIYNKSLSEAAASMWLWLKENNYLEAK